MDLREGIALPHLRAWRENRLLTQGELAKRSKVSRGTIIAAENGRRIRLTNVGKLAKALQIQRQVLAYHAPHEVSAGDTR